MALGYSEKKDIRSDFSTAFWFFVIVVLFMVGAGFVLVSGGGVSNAEFKERFVLYSILGGLGFAFLFGVDLFNFISGTRALKTIIHEPEESVVGSWIVARYPMLLVVFLPLMWGLVALSSSQSFFVSGSVPQSFLTSSSAVVSGFLSRLVDVFSKAGFPSLAENLFAFVLLCLAYTFVFKRLFRSNKPVFYLITLLGFPIVFGLFWMFFHSGAYGFSDVALRSTLFFGVLGVFFSMLFVSFIVWAVMHFLLNFMILLRGYGLLANDGWIVGLVLVEVLFVLLFVLALRYYKMQKRVS
jgi:hypothetical protein